METTRENGDSAYAERLIAKPELARLVGKTTRTIDAWMQAGLVPFLKLPGGKRGTVLFKWSDVLQALERFRRN